MATNAQITDNFSYHELACKGDDSSCGGCQALPISDLLYFHMDRLQNLRSTFGEPLNITSGHRCECHNRHVGGAPKSMHLALATDIRPSVKAKDLMSALDEIADLAYEMSFGGVGLYNDFVHIDSREYIQRKIARWSNRT